MKSPFYFIVKPLKGKRYDNTRTIGDIELVVSTSEEDHKFANRYAEVVELPIGYNGGVAISDTLLVHHNVFKFYNDMKGNQRSGRSFFKDDLFFVDNEQFFLYKHNDKWIAHDRYCFVKPIPTIESYIYKPFAEEPLMGKIKYVNEYLKSKGVKSGDTVTFLPDTEYEFNIDGEKLYRMYDHHISMVI
jgi:hypothetical protein